MIWQRVLRKEVNHRRKHYHYTDQEAVHVSATVSITNQNRKIKTAGR